MIILKTKTMQEFPLFAVAIGVGVFFVSLGVAKLIKKKKEKKNVNSQEAFFTGRHKPFESSSPNVEKTAYPNGKVTYWEEGEEKGKYLLGVDPYDYIEDKPIEGIAGIIEEEAKPKWKIEKDFEDIKEEKEEKEDELTEEEKELLAQYKQDYNSTHEDEII
jgi:hypothetical protein